MFANELLQLEMNGNFSKGYIDQIQTQPSSIFNRGKQNQIKINPNE